MTIYAVHFGCPGAQLVPASEIACTVALPGFLSTDPKAQMQEELALVLQNNCARASYPDIVAFGALRIARSGETMVTHSYGVLQAALLARGRGLPLLLSPDSVREAEQVDCCTLLPVESLEDAKCIIRDPGKQPARRCVSRREERAISQAPEYDPPEGFVLPEWIPGFSAGHTGYLLIGHVETQKLRIARAMHAQANIGFSESMREEASLIHSRAGMLSESHPFLLAPPIRVPHHTASQIGMLGSSRRPGEVSLAHRGVLVLDQVSEFSRSVIEAVAEDLEIGKTRYGWPAKPLLVVATSLACPCGWSGSTVRKCSCPDKYVQAFRSRLTKLAELLHLKELVLE